MTSVHRLAFALALGLTPGALAALAMAGCEGSRRQAQEEPAGVAVDVTDPATGKTATVRRDGPGPGEALRQASEARREFRAKTEHDLAELDRSIGELEGKAQRASGQAKQDLDAALVKARAARRTVQQSLEGADAVLDATWGSFKDKVERGVAETRRAVDDATKL
jgi:hypothetical protein